MTKIHVTLAKAAEAQLRKVVEKIVSAAGMTQINEKRLDRYGILSGLVPEESIPIIRKMAGVDGVDADTERFATEGKG